MRAGALERSDLSNVNLFRLPNLARTHALRFIALFFLDSDVAVDEIRVLTERAKRSLRQFLLRRFFRGGSVCQNRKPILISGFLPQDQAVKVIQDLEKLRFDMPGLHREAVAA